MLENGSLAVRNKDWLIGKTLYVDRGFENEGIDAWVGGLRARGWLPPERPTMADAGANIGMISTAMLLRGHFRSAIAFEPAPDSFRLLAANAARNGLAERVRIAQSALSSAAGEAELGLSADNSGDNRIEATGAQRGWYREERRPRVRVATISLDAWLAASGPDAREIGLLSMDVQGHETHVLAGARSLLVRVPVVMELWPYAMERSGLGIAALAKLASECSGGFLSAPRRQLRNPRDLPAFAESLGNSPRAMCQIAPAPREKRRARRRERRGTVSGGGAAPPAVPRPQRRSGGAPRAEGHACADCPLRDGRPGAAIEVGRQLSGDGKPELGPLRRRPVPRTATVPQPRRMAPEGTAIYRPQLTGSRRKRRETTRGSLRAAPAPCRGGRPDTTCRGRGPRCGCGASSYRFVRHNPSICSSRQQGA